MPDVRLVTCREPDPPDHDSTLLLKALRDAGASCDLQAWDDDAVDWGEARLSVIRSTWNYVAHFRRFLSWIETTSTRTRLINAPALLRWNSHKGYLLELGNTVPVIAGELVPQDARICLQELANARRWNSLVIKPAVSAGGWLTRRCRLDASGQRHLDRVLSVGDALVQPYESEICSAGERSLIFIDGQCVHAVRKEPADDDFRVQEKHGARIEPVHPAADELALGEAALAAVPGSPVYARVDCLRVGGETRLMELELIEPSLFFTHAPDTVARLTKALLGRLA